MANASSTPTNINTWPSRSANWPGQEDPTHSQTIDIRPVEDFYELRDKGGILGRLNVRVFYLVHKTPHLIVILGVIKKENNGPTPTVDKVRMRRRQRHYLESLPPQPPSTT